MSVNSNKDLYSEDLFEIWSKKKGLIPLEAYFLNKYLLNKKGKTIEAGTGGGRIIFEIEKQGFSDLKAFDYVEKMVSFCNKEKLRLKSSIKFKIADATNLKNYKTNTFDYLIYFQQVLCFINKDKLPLALKEAHRIGNEKSIYLFSFLNWDSKFYNPILSMLVNLFRIIRAEKVNKYQLPWLNINGKFNWKFLNKNQPQNMWYKEKDITKILGKNRFLIIEVKTRVNTSEKIGHIHIACKKSD